jgi:hypothetical protein
LQREIGRGQQTADGWPDFIGGHSRVVSLTAEHDRKSDVPVILYAEFTAKPGSESLVQTLISDLAAKVRHQPGESSLIEEGASKLTFLTRFDPP